MTSAAGPLFAQPPCSALQLPQGNIRLETDCHWSAHISTTLYRATLAAAKSWQIVAVMLTKQWSLYYVILCLLIPLRYFDFTGGYGWPWGALVCFQKHPDRIVQRKNGGFVAKSVYFFFRHPSAEGMLVVDLLRYLAYKVTKKQGIELNNIWWKDKQLCEWRWMKI